MGVRLPVGDARGAEKAAEGDRAVRLACMVSDPRCVGNELMITILN